LEECVQEELTQENAQLKYASTVDLDTKVLEFEQSKRILQEEKDLEEAMKPFQLMEWKNRAGRVRLRSA
jgi:hypothetical protein